MFSRAPPIPLSVYRKSPNAGHPETHMTTHIRSHLSKYLVALSLCIFAAFAVGCAVDDTNTTPEQAQEYSSLKSKLAAADQKLAEAQAQHDANMEAVARAEKVLVEKEFAEFEARVLRERAGPIVAGAAAIHPALAPFAALAGALVPLLGQRGRKHAWDALQNLNPWGNLAPGEPPHPAPIEAIVSLWKMSGAGHSTPESAAAANAASGAAVPQPNSPAGA